MTKSISAKGRLRICDGVCHQNSLISCCHPTFLCYPTFLCHPRAERRISLCHPERSEGSHEHSEGSHEHSEGSQQAIKRSMEKSIQIKKRVHLSGRAKEIIIDGIRYLFIFLFIYTAYSKGTDYSGFGKSLARYSTIERYADPIAGLVIAAEVFVSGLLLFPKTQRLGLIASLILMLTFTISLLLMVFTMDTQFCSCGGVLNSMGAKEHIWFNIGFIALAIIGIMLSKKSVNTLSSISRRKRRD